MAKRRRAPVLDEFKRREILAILTVGGSRRTAARYVGCAPATIRRTAEKDAEFAEQLCRAENTAEIGYLKNIQKAAAKEQYWRAAAWALERRHPEEYGPRRPNLVSVQEIKEFVSRIVDLVVAAVPVDQFRKNVIREVRRLATELDPSPPEKAPNDET